MHAQKAQRQSQALETEVLTLFVRTWQSLSVYSSANCLYVSVCMRFALLVDG
jgi:hypothetical protein